MVNRITSVTKTSNKKYPRQVKIKVGGEKFNIINLPDKKKFGSFVSKHGCSMETLSVALAMYGVIKSPSECADYCKKNIKGYNGSKLTIYGLTKAFNMITGRKLATWHSNTGKSNKKIVNKINNAIKDGCIVAFEQDDPIHTVLFLGRFKSGELAVETYGHVTRSTINAQVKHKALHGKSHAKNQTNWFKGRDHAAGYVIIKKG